MIRIKKIIISLLIGLAIAVISGNPKSAGINWIFSYIIASLFQHLAIANDRPQYKKVLKHTLWIAGILCAFLFAYLLYSPQFAVLKYGLDINNSAIFLTTVLWGYTSGYITIAIIGLLTVFWLTRSKQSHNQPGGEIDDEIERELKVNELVKRGQRLLRAGKYEQALGLYSSIINFSDPENASAYFFRGAANHKLGNKEQALNDLKSAAKLGHMKSEKILNIKRDWKKMSKSKILDIIYFVIGPLITVISLLNFGRASYRSGYPRIGGDSGYSGGSWYYYPFEAKIGIAIGVALICIGFLRMMFPPKRGQ